jgi:hypothetical protein
MLISNIAPKYQKVEYHINNIWQAKYQPGWTISQQFGSGM